MHVSDKEVAPASDSSRGQDTESEASMSSTRIPEATRERVLRGLVLYREHTGEIEHAGHGVYTVPGCSGATYTVDLDVFADDSEARETCTCPDHKRTHATCKHITAATIFRARTRMAARREAEAKRPKFAPDAIAANLARVGA